MRIRDYDLQVGLIKWRVIVATVPQDDVCFLLRLSQDPAVIDARVDDRAFTQMRLVFFALFNGALMSVQVLHHGKTLDRLGGKIAVGHGMAHHYYPLSFATQLRGYQASHRTLTATCAHRADRDHRDRRFQLRSAGTQQPKVGTARHHSRRQMHQVRVGNITVGEDRGINLVFFHQAFEIFFFENRDSRGIKRPGQFSGIPPVSDAGNLVGGEGYDVVLRVAAKHYVEIVEVSSSRAENQNLFRFHSYSFGLRLHMGTLGFQPCTSF